MNEFFDISLILLKNDRVNFGDIDTIIQEKLGFKFGMNNQVSNSYFLLNDKNVGLFKYEYLNHEFMEYTISIENFELHPQRYKEEFLKIQELVNELFAISDHFLFALCSYEINAYFLSKIYKIEEFTTEFLSKFPFVVSRVNNKEIFKLNQETNLMGDTVSVIQINAQNLW